MITYDAVLALCTPERCSQAKITNLDLPEMAIDEYVVTLEVSVYHGRIVAVQSPDPSRRTHFPRRHAPHAVSATWRLPVASLTKSDTRKKERGNQEKSNQKKRRQLSAVEVRRRWRNTEVEMPLDARLSFVVLVREDAEELPAKPRVVDPQHDPGHVDDPQGT
ncbi:hypothetical protein B296_00011976 [Ensete ventricosum]|uniref:Uncharacterized protein n=1 Tax=Ensete ventricosum TaxID=4639 RepID=A0A426XQV5_ENSVE|nr:hypothetical protein B296_00011976 [Ensete ventricosum]